MLAGMALDPTHISPGERVADDGDLLSLAQFVLRDDLLPHRCLHLTWLDDGDRVTGLLLPLGAIPTVPDAERATRFGDLVRTVIDEHAPGGSVVGILERPGGALIQHGDRAWNSMLRAQGVRLGFRVRGFFVATQAGVRPLALDDALLALL
ncbi:hypothetical protein Xcel_0921 [Xylanimonas cellulosilytica DSM 15894]|uniref:Uncharacterized protein n=2 Tax=Xylanimonas TaxID=186188 RepID=D1BYA9_XYLCX|nr:hypothetical protein Xcel_0921 [Xylanimonas cellulosilytica DSM 15894]